ncbi:DnaJ C-terminal domain-containing protein [Dermatophilaceae bacterium Soc4.6]
MASQDWLEKDFYATLGIAADADDAAIKKSYRKLARQLHPDQTAGDATAEKRFKEVGEAYAILSDPEQRKEYDQIRAMSRGGARFTSGGQGSGGGFEDLFSSFGGGGGGRTRYSTGGGGQGAPGGGSPDINDLLGSLFGGGAGAGGFPGAGGQPGFDSYGATRGPRKGTDAQARTTLSFRDAVQGSTVTLSAAGHKVTTRLPAGVSDGQKIRLRGKGNPGGAGAASGDLIITVTVQKHPVFGRDGDNLTIDLPVTFAEAALGATVQVPTLDGTPVRVKVAPGTPSGRQLRLKGRGVVRETSTGDLIARVLVVVPQRLTKAARAAIEQLQADEAEVDPRAELFDRATAP